MISPELTIRVHAHPSRRQRALQALLPQAVVFMAAGVFLLSVLVNA